MSFFQKGRKILPFPFTLESSASFFAFSLASLIYLPSPPDSNSIHPLSSFLFTKNREIGKRLASVDLDCRTPLSSLPFPSPVFPCVLEKKEERKSSTITVVDLEMSDALKSWADRSISDRSGRVSKSYSVTDEIDARCMDPR